MTKRMVQQHTGRYQDGGKQQYVKKDCWKREGIGDYSFTELFKKKQC